MPSLTWCIISGSQCTIQFKAPVHMMTVLVFGRPPTRIPVRSTSQSRRRATYGTTTTQWVTSTRADTLGSRVVASAVVTAIG